MVKLFPIIFVLLWSSAFITTKPIIDYSDPFAALSFRFFFVALGFFFFSLILGNSLKTSGKNIINSILSGVLFHGFYLGGVFYSISIGMPTGVTALIVTLQPVLTNILAGPLLKEKIYKSQWFGMLLGFIGACLVLGFDIGNNLPIKGVIAAFISLFAITFSTIWQKKIGNSIPLSSSNMYQAIGGCLFHVMIIILFTSPKIIFSQTFILAMSHQIILVSFGAFTILMYLIKNNSASKTVSVFFLIPPTSAIIAWIFLDEYLTFFDIIGFIVASFGVFISTRNQNLK